MPSRLLFLSRRGGHSLPKKFEGYRVYFHSAQAAARALAGALAHSVSVVSGRAQPAGGLCRSRSLFASENSEGRALGFSPRKASSKAQARALQVTTHSAAPNIFHVKNESKNSSYRVNLFTGGLLCDCEDFKNQAQFFGKACCKHGYAALGYLGFKSLGDWIEQRRE